MQAPATATQRDNKPYATTDRAGTVAQRLLLGMCNHAAWLVEHGYAHPATVDTAMRLGAGMREGPLQALDSIGLDTAYAALRALHASTGQWRHNPAPVLRELVTAGLLGRKSGRGFHRYDDDQADGKPDASMAPVMAPAMARPRVVRSVGVVGTGTMGRGIAQALITAGYSVRILGRDADKVEDARESIGEELRAAGLDDARAADAVARLRPTRQMDEIADCELVVEAVVEDHDIKLGVFAQLGRTCRSNTVLATTTSSLPVIDCAMASGRPADVVGMHFFNPVASMDLVELVATTHTNDEVTATALAVTNRLGKQVVRCRDRAGFIVNLLLFPYLNEALGLVAKDEIDSAKIDASIRAGTGLPIGPFQLLDLVGADVALGVLRNLYTEFGEPDFAPATLLQELVEAGYLGRKTGRGIRHYLADHGRGELR